VADHAVVRDVFNRLEPFTSPAGSEGFEVATLVDRATGSHHVELAVCRLAPGGHVGGHLHPFEESFFMFEGDVVLTIDRDHHAISANDFGFVPVSAPHGWRNVGDEPAVWYRIRSPQPRRVGPAQGTFPVPDLDLAAVGRAPRETHPLSRNVGRFAESDLPAPGPLTMPGAHGHNIRDVAVRMMVDDVLGSVHHQMFMVQFEPSAEDRFSGSAHYHDFEEAYFVVSGRGEVELEGERFMTSAGDLVWEATGIMHAWRAVGDEPLRFIELMAPRPPYTNMLFSEATWVELGEDTLGD
jgi:quercetin dioxygenase-like cupin family protein